MINFVSNNDLETKCVVMRCFWWVTKCGAAVADSGISSRLPALPCEPVLGDSLCVVMVTDQSINSCREPDWTWFPRSGTQWTLQHVPATRPLEHLTLDSVGIIVDKIILRLAIDKLITMNLEISITTIALSLTSFIHKMLSSCNGWLLELLQVSKCYYWIMIYLRILWRFFHTCLIMRTFICFVISLFLYSLC